MSKCISRHGEYSEHEYGSDPFTCDLCGVCAEDEIRDELDRLRTAENDAVRAYDDTLVKLAASMADADRLLARLELAEARVDQLTDTLTRRSDALNRTGADNDRLRATLARIGALARGWASEGIALGKYAYSARDVNEGSLLERCAADLAAALEPQEPARD